MSAKDVSVVDDEAAENDMERSSTTWNGRARHGTVEHDTSGKWEFPFATFSSFFCLIQLYNAEKGGKEEQKETNLFLFLLMGKRQKKEEKGASPSFFSLL